MHNGLESGAAGVNALPLASPQAQELGISFWDSQHGAPRCEAIAGREKSPYIPAEDRWILSGVRVLVRAKELNGLARPELLDEPVVELTTHSRTGYRQAGPRRGNPMKGARI